MASESDYGATILALGLYGTFPSFMPSLREVRHSTPGDAELVKDVRVGEVLATGVSLLIGGVASSMTGNPLAFFVAVLVCAGMVALYEWNLYAVNNPDRSTNPTVPSEGN